MEQLMLFVVWFITDANRGAPYMEHEVFYDQKLAYSYYRELVQSAAYETTRHWIAAVPSLEALLTRHPEQRELWEQTGNLHEDGVHCSCGDLGADEYCPMRRGYRLNRAVNQAARHWDHLVKDNPFYSAEVKGEELAWLKTRVPEHLHYVITA